MRYFLGFALVLFFIPLSSFAVIQVNYFKNDAGTEKALFHSGASASELTSSLFRQMEGDYDRWIRACPFWPQAFHRGAGYCYAGAGGWVGAVSKDTRYILEEVNPMWFPNEDLLNVHQGFLKPFCSGCTGTFALLREYTCTVVAGSSADQPWLWNGGADNNPLVQNLQYTFDEAGNINGYSYTINQGGLPFGAVLDGANANGTIVLGSNGPTFQWGEGVVPPIDPNLIGNISSSMSEITSLLSLNQETLLAMATSGQLSADRLDAVLSALQSQGAISTSLESINYNVSDLVDIVAALSLTGGGGDSSAVVDELVMLENMVEGEEPTDESQGEDAGLVSSHNALVGALNPSAMQGHVAGLSASGQFLKDTVNSVFGSWRALPRVKPSWTFRFTVPVLGKNYTWDWSSLEKIPDSWWVWVSMLRNAEVIGLAVWLFFALSNLLHKTFGGAS